MTIDELKQDNYHFRNGLAKANARIIELMTSYSKLLLENKQLKDTISKQLTTASPVSTGEDVESLKKANLALKNRLIRVKLLLGDIDCF